MAEQQDQYSSAKPMFGQLESWVADPLEQRRLAAYTLYESIYWCVPDTFKLTARGTEDKPIYIPSGRVIVETMHRFLANDVQFIEDPTFGTDAERLLAKQVMTDLSRRERLYSRFNANKRYGIIRGDWMWHLYADPERQPGSKISVFQVDPSTVFPIYNPDNVDEVVGYHVVESFVDPEDNQTYIKRLTYLKQSGSGGPSPIEVSEGLFKPDDWGGPGMDPETEPVRPIRGTELLPAPIDDLPIYHIQNFYEPGSIWGSSEMRGLERIMAAINQAISDEELALALEGLGVYTTDAGKPVNDDGQDVPWNISPGRVVELPDGKVMNRLEGISSVQPNIDHMKYLENWLMETVGASDVARGRVDVQVAESGVALAIELAPLLARVKEREQVVTDVMTNLLFNIPKWYVAYEGTAFNSLMETTRWIPMYGPKIPRNVDAEVKELLSIAQSTPQIVSMAWVRDQLRGLGYEIPDEATINNQITAETAVAQDAVNARIDQELQSIGELQNQQ